jgi:hypothetical protein
MFQGRDQAVSSAGVSISPKTCSIWRCARTHPGLAFAKALHPLRVGPRVRARLSWRSGFTDAPGSKIAGQRRWVHDQFFGQIADADAVEGRQVAEHAVLRNGQSEWLEVLIVNLGDPTRSLTQAQTGAAAGLGSLVFDLGHASVRSHERASPCTCRLGETPRSTVKEAAYH